MVVRRNKMRIMTWNINSVRLRLGLLLSVLEEHAPEILCLQETKCQDEYFPHGALEDAGYGYRAVRGEKSYNGVAILSKLPLFDIGHEAWAGREDCRHLSASFDSGGRRIELHNFYVPAGGDIADAGVNEKFAHKLKFLDELRAWSLSQGEGEAVLVGDLNIAPREDDVWSHKQLLGVVSHTPIECEKLNQVMDAGGWCDVVRKVIPTGKLYSWWSYRAREWEASDRGRRLDHIWMTEGLAMQVRDARVLRAVRGAEKPSDHAPVMVALG